MRIAKILFVTIFIVLVFTSGSSEKQNTKYDKITVNFSKPKKMNTSWYGVKFHNKKTASGERFNATFLTAAHRYLPIGTRLKVINPKNNRFVVVRVNDRGPFHSNRDLDLSLRAAQELGIVDIGVAELIVYRITTIHRKKKKL